MRWSQCFLVTLKENPSDAEIPSHRLLVRAGLIRKLAPGIFTLSSFFLRSLRKLEVMIREEMTKAGAEEILMPMVQPQELWEETDRWKLMGDGLARFKNRGGHGFCLGATHEEAVTDFVRGDLRSYRDLPFTLFQIQTKFRDEIRPRFGLMRGREFIMKDAYSFDRDKEGALNSYERMHQAYQSLFRRLNLDFRVVEADTGSIGGNLSHEFQIIAESGEDRLFISSDSAFAANAEVCPAPLTEFERQETEQKFEELEEFPTPGLRTIDELAQNLGVESGQLVKTLFVALPEKKGKSEFIAVLLKGDDELNLIKLKLALGLEKEPQLLNDQEVKLLTGAAPGSCGPVGLSVRVFADQALKLKKNFIVGANRDDFHFKNVNFGRDVQVESFVDIRFAKSGMPSPDGKGSLIEKRGIEVGHIFYLGKKYSSAMNAQFLDSQGKSQHVEMGCYGIGVTRLLQAAVEQSHDQDGIIWPVSLAPFHVHICLLDPKSERAQALVQELNDELAQNGVAVFIDDRDERPGIKFKDADLIGLPLRINVGERGLENDQIEIIDRSTKKKESVSPARAVEWIQNWMRGQL